MATVGYTYSETSDKGKFQVRDNLFINATINVPKIKQKRTTSLQKTKLLDNKKFEPHGM